jgi:tRNA-dihydrouridine synthase
VALVQLKKHLAWYSAGLPGSAGLRAQLFAASDPASVQALFWSAW